MNEGTYCILIGLKHQNALQRWSLLNAAALYTRLTHVFHLQNKNPALHISQIFPVCRD